MGGCNLLIQAAIMTHLDAEVAPLMVARIFYWLSD
tara:strand:- start:37 stop:141 length:105 start_codon:yes stop_codon:yes gene_type:complete